METMNREYKSKLTDDIEREIVGFLNTMGGELLIGVDNNGSVIGLENIDGDALALADRIKNNIAPSVMGLFTLDLKESDGKRHILVTVAGGFEKPYYLKKYGMTPKGCFTRIGAQTSPMEQGMIDALYARRVIRTLQTVVSPRQDLTFSQLKIFYQEKGFEVGSDFFLKNLDFYTEDGKFNYVAYLMADNNATYMRVVRYAGKDKTVIASKSEFGSCCLLKSAYNILDYLNIFNETAIEITYPRRIETKLVDNTALRETVLNAILHNDYIHGSYPVVEFYDDRVEVTSTGGLPAGLTQEEFFAGHSMPRNREIMRVFADMDLCERLGSGMQRIMGVYSKDDFTISPNFVVAVFKYNKHALDILSRKNDNVNDEVNDNVNDGENALSKTALMVLDIIKTQKTITADEIAKAIQKSKPTADRAIKELKDKNLIQRIGSDKSGYWEITAK
jgi:predicted HTH transcriptional regulator